MRSTRIAIVTVSMVIVVIVIVVIVIVVLLPLMQLLPAWLSQPVATLLLEVMTCLHMFVLRHRFTDGQSQSNFEL